MEVKKENRNLHQIQLQTHILLVHAYANTFQTTEFHLYWILSETSHYHFLYCSEHTGIKNSYKFTINRQSKIKFEAKTIKYSITSPIKR